MPLQEGQTQQGAPWRKLTIVVMEDDPSIMYPNQLKTHPPTPPVKGGERLAQSSPEDRKVSPHGEI